MPRHCRPPRNPSSQRERPYRISRKNRTWTSIPRRSCQSYARPIRPGTSLHRIYITVFQNLELYRFRESSRVDTDLAPQVLYKALRKRQLLSPIGYILQGQIVRYHGLGQVSHDLGGRRDLGYVMCRDMSGSSSLNSNTIMVAARVIRRPLTSLTPRE